MTAIPDFSEIPWSAPAAAAATGPGYPWVTPEDTAVMPVSGPDDRPAPAFPP